jgi:hypothetical protein
MNYMETLLEANHLDMETYNLDKLSRLQGACQAIRMIKNAPEKALNVVQK